MAAPGTVASVAYDGSVAGTAQLASEEVPSAMDAEDGVAWVSITNTAWLARVSGPGDPAEESAPEVPAVVERRSFGMDPVEQPGDPAFPDETGSAAITEIRAAHHQGFDRIVVQFEDRLPNRYSVALTSEPGTGECTTPGVQGRAYLSLTFSYTGTPPGQPVRIRPDSTLINELVVTCEFEASVDLAIGMARVESFRVLALDDPVRLVIDVQLG
jgi:hypothetical protein